MGKKENYRIVRDAEDRVKTEVGRKVYGMLGTAQKLQLIQDALPTKPLFCTAQINKIINAGHAKD